MFTSIDFAKVQIMQKLSVVNRNHPVAFVSKNRSKRISYSNECLRIKNQKEKFTLFKS